MIIFCVAPVEMEDPNVELETSDVELEVKLARLSVEVLWLTFAIYSGKEGNAPLEIRLLAKTKRPTPPTTNQSIYIVPRL